MADVVDDLFVFGDDFEVMLDILEEDEALEEEFTAIASDVQTGDIICRNCGKKCKSKGGYKRHRAAKHQDDHRVNFDASKTNTDQTPETSILTPVILTKIVLKVLQSVKENEVFSTSIRNELSSYKHKELEEGTTEFSVLKALFEGYAKKGNTEKFYGAYYAQVPLKSTTFFPGLSHNAATLLATKVADGMLSYCNDLKSSTNKSESSKTVLSEKEIAGLQYVGGYVLHKLYKKYAIKKSSPENQQAMAILKGGKLEQDIESQKLVSSLNRGGLWSISQPAQNIFFHTEHYFRQQTSKSGLLKIDIDGIAENAIMDSQVISSFQSVVSDAEILTISNVNKDVLHAIVSLYIRVRSYSFAKDVIQSHKIRAKHTKMKALRKKIIRSCDQEKQDDRLE